MLMQEYGTPATICWNNAFMEQYGLIQPALHHLYYAATIYSAVIVSNPIYT